MPAPQAAAGPETHWQAVRVSATAGLSELSEPPIQIFRTEGAFKCRAAAHFAFMGACARKRERERERLISLSKERERDLFATGQRTVLSWCRAQKRDRETYLSLEREREREAY